MGKDRNIHDEITRVAYDLYEKKGRVHGCNLADWLEAERIVLQKHAMEIEQASHIIRSTKEKKTSGAAKAKTSKTSKKTSKSGSQTKTKKMPSKKKTQ